MLLDLLLQSGNFSSVFVHSGLVECLLDRQIIFKFVLEACNSLFVIFVHLFNSINKLLPGEQVQLFLELLD